MHALADQRNAIAHNASWTSIVEALSAVVDAFDGQWATYERLYPKIRALFRVLEALDAPSWADTADSRGRNGAKLVEDMLAALGRGDAL